MAFDPDRVLWKRSGGEASEDEDVWDDTALIEAYDRAINEVKENIAKKNKDSTKSSNKTKHEKPRKKNHRLKWQVGTFCQAIFSEDGKPYEACIKSINLEQGTCVVHYVGYGNEEEISLNSLLPSNGKKARLLQQAEAERYQNGEVSFESEESYFSESSKASSQKKHLPKHSAKGQRPTLHHQQSWLPPPPHPPPPPPSFAHGAAPVGPSWSSMPPPLPPLHLGACPLPKIPAFPPPLPLPLDDGIVSDEEALASMLMSWYMSGYHTGYYQALKHSRSHQDPSHKSSCNGCCHANR